MKIIKRNGAEVPFDITKIITAVTKASDSVGGKARLSREQITDIAAAVTDQCQALNRAVSVEEVQDMVEKPKVEEAPSRLAVLGRYVINPEIFPILEHTAPGRGNEIQLTDALKVLAKEQPMYAYNFEGRRYDVGDKQGFLEATVEMALKRTDLRDKFLTYLQDIVNKESSK